jgi:hypothetical protein
MRPALIFGAVISGLSIATVAAAQSAPAVESGASAVLQLSPGQSIMSADGHRVGTIDYIHSGKDGTSSYVGVIYDNRMVHIPVDSLVAGKRGYVTNLTMTQINRL